MSGNAGARRDRLESRIQDALDPGYFIGSGACFEFAGDLEEVEAEIASLTATERARAASPYEAFQVAAPTSTIDSIRLKGSAGDSDTVPESVATSSGCGTPATSRPNA